MISGRWKIVLLGILWLPGEPLFARLWTNAQGRTFEAEFVRREDATLIFVQPNGREFASPLADLSAADQAVIFGLARAKPPELVAANFGRPWPREIRQVGPVPCKVIAEDSKTGRYVYESPGYRFTCDARVTEDALRNFSVMFETTRKYAQELPLSLGAERQRQGRFDVFLFSTNLAYVKAGGPPGSAGVFVRGVVLVPMESLGLKAGNTGFSLDTQRSNKVLIHELAHQLTPSVYFGSGARGWFSEGLADYIAVTPYNWGYFSPDIHGNVVKSYVTARGANGMGGRLLGINIAAPKLKELFLMPYQEFSGPNARFNYGLGLLLTHYFLHMEGGGKAHRITQFLKNLRAGHEGEAALLPLLGGSTFERLEGDISAAWAKQGVQIHFGK